MPITGDDDIELSEYADAASSTYLLMEVEDFDGVEDGMHSYLRLGAVYHPDDLAISSKYEDLVNNGTAQTWVSSTGEDLASLVTTFVDDTRIRGGNFKTDSNATRQAETKLLHTKGGWRDHTDGNRITTTRGDKIEVIRGNYKMRVLGRSQWKDNAGSGLHYESSGGITYHYDEVPGQITDVRWSASDDTWRVFEECNYGHVVDRYHGVKKEWMRGGDVVDRVGDANWFKPDSDFDRPDGVAHDIGKWPATGSKPNVVTEVYANEVWEKTICNSKLTKRGAWKDWAESIDDHIYADKILDHEYFNVYESYKYCFTISAELWVGAFFEKFDGLGLSIKAGNFWDFRAGIALELNTVIYQNDLRGAAKIFNIEVSHAWMDVVLSGVHVGLQTGTTRQYFDAPTRTKASMSTAHFGLAFFLG